MLAYNCKQCGQIFIFNGYKNEFQEYFCDEKCYKKYCEKNHYKAHSKKLYKIKSIFN